jgi:hypothetical protein
MIIKMISIGGIVDHHCLKFQINWKIEYDINLSKGTAPLLLSCIGIHDIITF